MHKACYVAAMLSQKDFRKLVDKGRTEPKNKKPERQQPTEEQIKKKKEKRKRSYQDYLARKEKRKEKEGPKYRDRAKERREGKLLDYEDVEESLKNISVEHSKVRLLQ